MTERDPEIADKDVVIPVVAETDDSFLSDNRAFDGINERHGPRAPAFVFLADFLLIQVDWTTG